MSFLFAIYLPAIFVYNFAHWRVRPVVTPDRIFNVQCSFYFYFYIFITKKVLKYTKYMFVFSFVFFSFLLSSIGFRVCFRTSMKFFKAFVYTQVYHLPPSWVTATFTSISRLTYFWSFYQLAIFTFSLFPCVHWVMSITMNIWNSSTIAFSSLTKLPYQLNCQCFPKLEDCAWFRPSSPSLSCVVG